MPDILILLVLLLAVCVGRRTLVPVALCLCPAAASAQAFSIDDAERYAADGIGVPAFLAGVDSARISTKAVCARAANVFTDSAGEDFVSDFRYVSTVDQIFSDQRLAVGVRVGVKYMGVGASVDTRYGHAQSKASEFRNGAIYGYAERVEPIRFISAPRIRLNRRGRRLHDEAVRKRNLSIFYSECGDQLIVGRQDASFVQIIGTMNFISEVDEQTRQLAVTAAVKVATGVLDVEAETDVEETNKEIEAFEKLEVIATAVSSTNPPGCAAPNQTLDSVTAFFSCFTEQGSAATKDLHAVYTVPYSKVIGGFGELPEGSLTHGRRDDVERILDGLTFIEEAIRELERLGAGPADGHLDRRLKHLRSDYRHTVNEFVRDDGCLAEFTVGCENLFQRLKTFKPPTETNVRNFVRAVLQGNGSCLSGGALPVFNRNGIATCRRCGLGQLPVFLDGRNGECGFLVADPEINVVRLMPRDLSQTKVELVELPGGGTSELPVTRQFDICASRDARCGRKRATRICRDRGLARAVRWIVAVHSPTVYGDGTPCSVVDNFDDPTPAVCRTYGMLDCRCPKGEIRVGTTCVFVPSFAIGIDQEIHSNDAASPETDDEVIDLRDIIIRGPMTGPNAAPNSPIFNSFIGSDN